MIFDSQWLLLLAPLVAAAGAALAFWGRRRRVAATTAWSPSLGAQAARRGWAGPWVIGVAVLAGAVAVAGPRGGRTSVKTEARALSLVIATDISRSMLAEDVQPSRLGRAKREARRLVQDLDGDRLGLIAFAGRSYILTPLTVDGGAVSLYLDGLDPDLASEGGTSLAATLNQGLELLEATSEISDRVLVIFTDGETHDSTSAVEDAAAAIKQAGIRLILVGEGTPIPVKIPIRDASGQLIEYKLDQEGQVVETSLDESVLRAAAEAAGGTVVPASLSDQAGAVRDLVAAFKRSPSSESRAADLRPMGWVPLLIAAVLLLGQTLLRRGASLVALALAVALPASAHAQRPSAGERALTSGDPTAAAGAFLQEAREGDHRDTAFYNAGTAALRAGDLKVARRALLEAAKSTDPGLRYRSLYNLGVVNLRAAEADSTVRDTLVGEAVAHLREALLLEPGSERAKWNLELAERMRPPPPPSGGGGQKPPPPQSGQQPKPPDQSKSQNRGLTREQAEQILNSVEREERATRNRQLDRLAGGMGGAKDW
jgi:Ca-activated chloride channel family protein